jgi:hypothetical protein
MLLICDVTRNMGSGSITSELFETWIYMTGNKLSPEDAGSMFLGSDGYLQVRMAVQPRKSTSAFRALGV